MNHHHIPLATATALVAIARPAMAASGLGSTLISQLEYAGPTMMILGVTLIALKWFSLLPQRSLLDEEERMQLLHFSKTAQTGKFLAIGGIAVTLIWLLSELQ